MNHCSGSVVFFGAFKTNPFVCSGSAILTCPTGISYCQIFLYLIDIKKFIRIDGLSLMADNSTFRWY